MRLHLNHYLATVQRVLGLLLIVFSTTMLVPLTLELVYPGGEPWAFASGFGVTLIAGLACWLPVRKVRRELKLRDGFLVVVLFWTVLSLFGAIPFFVAARPDIGLTDAVFESASGLTTTGSTILTDIDALPHDILFWRQFLQWLGGMGVIVLAVAVLPMLGVGGMQLYRAETPGPIKDSKLTPRIRETAKALWLVYVALTAACGLGYWLAGMSLFDAVSHSFSTLSTGGYSPHNLSLGYFDSAVIESIAVVFMFLGAANFALHFLVWRQASLKPYLRDPEFKAWAALVMLSTLICFFVLLIEGTYTDIGTAALKSIFQVVSIGSTTGYVTANYTLWPSFIPMMLILGSVVAGCGGSTSGGIKVSRFLLLLKQGQRELSRQIHPSARMPIKLGGRVIPPRVIEAVWGFFSIYIGVYALTLLVLIATGMETVSAFSAVAACLNNMGPGLGTVAATMADIPTTAKWVLTGAMLLGRLEIFTMLVVLTPAFWRR